MSDFQPLFQDAGSDDPERAHDTQQPNAVMPDLQNELTIATGTFALSVADSDANMSDTVVSEPVQITEFNETSHRYEAFTDQYLTQIQPEDYANYAGSLLLRDFGKLSHIAGGDVLAGNYIKAFRESLLVAGADALLHEFMSKSHRTIDPVFEQQLRSDNRLAVDNRLKEKYKDYEITNIPEYALDKIDYLGSEFAVTMIGMRHALIQALNQQLKGRSAEVVLDIATLSMEAYAYIEVAAPDRKLNWGKFAAQLHRFANAMQRQDERETRISTEWLVHAVHDGDTMNGSMLARLLHHEQKAQELLNILHERARTGSLDAMLSSMDPRLAEEVRKLTK